MKKRQLNPNIYLGIVVVIMVVLFYSSAQTYHQQTIVPQLHHFLPGRPGLKLLQGIDFTYAGEHVSLSALGYAKLVEFFIRKCAHYGTYFLMGWFMVLGLKDRLRNLGLTGVVCYLACLGYAASDEFHQMLTGGRTPLFQDVMLDGTGALTAILILVIYFVIRQRKRSH